MAEVGDWPVRLVLEKPVFFTFFLVFVVEVEVAAAGFGDFCAHVFFESGVVVAGGGPTFYVRGSSSFGGVA